MTEMTAHQAVKAGLFRWLRLSPGDGTILMCARCGALAHTSGLPEAYPGVNGTQRHLIGDGDCVDAWRARHACDRDRDEIAGPAVTAVLSCGHMTQVPEDTTLPEVATCTTGACDGEREITAILGEED